MNTRATLALIAALSTLATPVVVKATGSRPAATAAASVAWVDPPATAPAAKPAPIVQAAASEAASACTRKVRVVYQGYGGAGEGCAR